LFLAARQASQFPDRSAGLAVILELVSWPLAFIVALALTASFAPGTASGLEASVFSAAYALLALDIARRTGSRILAKAISGSVSIFVALSFTFAVMFEPSAASALCSLVGGLLLLLWGAAGKKPVTVVAALVTLSAGAWFGLDEIVQLVITSSWIELAVFGASAIALGSILDRHGVAIKLRLSRWYAGANGHENDKAIALEN
jgi:hypothetical protein